MPSYKKSAINNNPGIGFASGESFNVGSLNLNVGNVQAFIVGHGQGVGIGASSGSIGWTLDVKTNPRLGMFFNEGNVLQQITLGKDPSTGFGQFVGELCEIMIFDRILSSSEKEKIEGYLAHKWGILDDLVGTSYKVRTGLTLYYPFEETDGTNVQDISPNLLNGELIDGSLNVGGYFGSGVEFDNEDNAQISLGLNQIQLPMNWTISAWFTTPFSDDNDWFVHALTSGSNDAHVAFLADPTNRVLGSFDNSFESSGFSAFALPNGWHHLVAVGNGGKTSFWIDGNSVGSVQVNVSSPVEAIGNLPGGSGRFANKIDDFRIFNRSLGEVEIEDLYGGGNGDFGSHYYSNFSPVFDNVPEIITPSAPLVHWTLNELNGTIIPDSSGKNNDGNASAFSDLYLFSEGGRDGTALRFDGNESILLAQNDATLNLSDSFAISFWLNTSDLDGVIVRNDRLNISISNGFMSGEAFIDGAWKVSDSFPMVADQWVHYIYQWDGNKILFFANNSEISAPVNAKGKLVGDGTGGDFYFGKHPRSESFSGQIDDVRFYGQVLTAEERQGVHDFEDSPLIARFGEEYSYKIETIKGPTEFNATALPSGLEIDQNNGIIFGIPDEVGDFNSTIKVSNISGSDTEIFNFVVLKGQQTINVNEEIGEVTYGIEPFDLNVSSTSGLPVSYQVVEGNTSVDLNGTLVKVLNPGTVKIKVSQGGNDNWLSAEPIFIDIQIMKKELVVRVDNQFRKTYEPNPSWTYQISGFVNGDTESDLIQSVTVSSPVPSGSLSNPTTAGFYNLYGIGVISDQYFATYLEGVLTVSDKIQNEIIFDQNLSRVSATFDQFLLQGYSRTLSGELTYLPIVYAVEDESVARILVTREDVLTAHWKLDESLYTSASDSMGNYNGTLVDLVSVGPSKVWKKGKFANGISLGTQNGRVELGSVPIDGSFTLSLWIKPTDVNGTGNLIMGKQGFNQMNVFSFEKIDGNGTIEFNLCTDGNSSNVQLRSSAPVLKQNKWVHVGIVYDDSNESNQTLELFVDGNLSSSVSGFTLSGLPLSNRFSPMSFGGAFSNSSFDGMIDDARVYSDDLNESEILQIFGNGGGDFGKLKIVGSGITKITALQEGNDLFAPAVPIENYLSVFKASQTISFGEVKDHSVGDFPFALDANSSSGLPLSFATSDPSKATVKNGKVYIHGPGFVSITAFQLGDSRFESAESVDQNFTIGYGNLFSDSAPGLKLWFDANDVNADDEPDDIYDFIRTLGKQRVSMWGDKSGNTNHPIQAEVSNMPSWSPNSLNFKPVVSFDSSADEVLDIKKIVSDPEYIFIVHKHNFTNPTQEKPRVLGGSLSTVHTDGYFGFEDNVSGVEIISDTNASSWSVSSFRVIPESQTLWVNGKVANLLDPGSPGAASTTVDMLGEAFTGEIAEVLVYENSINSVNRQKIEGYLAHKWGLTDQLQHIHPYSEKPPVFGGAQEIIFNPLVDMAMGDSSFSLNAISTSGLPITYISSNPSVALVVGEVVTITGKGKTTITALQLGDDRYHPAVPVSQILNVIHPGVKDDQLIDFEIIPEKVRDDPSFQLIATAESSGVNHPVFNLPVKFTLNHGDPAFVNSVGILTLEGLEGNVTVTATQSGRAYVNPAPPVVRTFYVSSKQRQVIRFPNVGNPDSLRDTPRGHRPLTLQGIRSTSGIPLRVVSSDTSVVKIFRDNQIIPIGLGSAELTFTAPGNDSFVTASPVSKTINVVQPNKRVWRDFRKGDVRYSTIQDRFSRKKQLLNANIDMQKVKKVFNEGYSDSDGDGFSNLFERAIGSDSLGPDRKNDLPIQINNADGRQRISFIRYKDVEGSTLATAGEEFIYHVEQSENLQTWSKLGLVLEKSVEIGGGMIRQVWVTSPSISKESKRYLRLRITTP